MTNREEIEKRFDERFWDLWKLDIYEWWIAVWYVNNNEQVKSFFLDEIILEVLRDIKDKLMENQRWQFESDSWEYAFFLKDLKKSFIRIAKEKYNLNI